MNKYFILFCIILFFGIILDLIRLGVDIYTIKQSNITRDETMQKILTMLQNKH